MIIGEACKRFFEILRSNWLFGYPVFSDYLFDPNMSYDPELRRYIVSRDISFKDSVATENWVGIVWNRESIKSDNGVTGRSHLARGEVILDKSATYTARLGVVNLDILLFSPDMDTLENIEETLYLTEIPENLNFSVFDPALDIEASMSKFKVGEYQFEEVQQFGSLTALALTASVVIPIFAESEEAAAVILYPELSIYTQREHPKYKETS